VSFRCIRGVGAFLLLAVLPALCQPRYFGSGRFLLDSWGSLTTDPAEVISGRQSIKGSYFGTESYRPYVRTDPSALPLAPNRTYRITFRYKILTTPNRGFEVLFSSPTAGNLGNFLPSFTITGQAGSVGTATLTNTLNSFSDYEARLNIVGTGAIVVDDLQITDMSTGQVVASEDAEIGLVGMFVLATKTSFLWGESVKVTAAVRDSSGSARSGNAVSWSVIPPEAATVAADGIVTPRALTTFTIRATSGGLTGEVRMQALPKQIRVVPEQAVVAVGSVQRIRAEALDVNDRPIPNPAVQWSIRNQGGGTTSGATIDAGGMMTAAIQSRVRVIANINYQTIVGFTPQMRGEAVVEIQAPRTYRFERIFVGRRAATSTSVLSERPSPLVPTETGGFVFTATLDGLGSALLEWNAGEITPLLLSGRSHLQSGQPLIEFESYSRNVDGQMLVNEIDAGGQSQISSGPAAQITPLLVTNSPLYVGERASFRMQRGSLAAYGMKLVQAGYEDAVSKKYTQGLFRGYGRGLSEAVLTLDSVEDYRVSVSSWVDWYGIADDGTAWFKTEASDGGVPILWKSRLYRPPERILTRGDAFGSEVFQGVSGLYTWYPNLFVAPNGDAIVGINTNRGNRYALWRGGNTEAAPEVLAAATNGIHWYHPAVGALLDTNVSGRGSGLYLWNRDGAQPLVLLNDTSLDGSPVEQILSATCNAAGTIYVMVRTAANPLLIARIAPDRSILLKAGDAIPISVPTAIASMVPGARNGIPLVITGGQTGSIARLDESGQVTPVIRIGDRLPDGKYYRGSKRDHVRALPDGRIFFAQDLFTNDSGIYMWNEDRIEMAMGAPILLENGRRVGAPNWLEVNRHGDIATIPGFAFSGLFLVRDGRASLIVEANPVIDGVSFTGPYVPAIDDAGRVIFLLKGPGGDYLAAWENGSARIILAPGQKMPDGRIVSSGLTPKACSDGFTANTLGTLARYTGRQWEYLVGSSDRLATGNPVNASVQGNLFDLNHSCDAVFQSRDGGTSLNIAARVGGKYHQIHSLGDLTPEGDLLVAVVQLLINDDGMIFVLGSNDRGEEVIYRATPLR